MARRRPYHYVKRYLDAFTVCGLHTYAGLTPLACYTTTAKMFVTCERCLAVIADPAIVRHPVADANSKGA